MDNEKVKIYRLDDKIAFRKCTLHDGQKSEFGDCTEFREFEENWRRYFACEHYGIHLHCTKHPEIEYEVIREYGRAKLRCKKCGEDIKVENLESIYTNCLKLLNIEKFKNAQLIRLDDWYIPEIKEKVKINSDYWMSVNVKTDKDGETIIVLYVGNKNQKEKSQFFIKPEKLQLSTDYKDLDPATILTKIEVVLKDRILKQEYDN